MKRFDRVAYLLNTKGTKKYTFEPKVIKRNICRMRQIIRIEYILRNR